MPRTNVIIPFFQREPGILPVAVTSALAQGGEDLLVTVVDDGSPVPARAELADIISDDHRVSIIEQPNAGPGAARNRGLDATPANVEQIAFLDSDDRWLPGHLANGTMALQMGADFYFADFQRWNTTSSRFAQVGFDESLGVRSDVGQDLFFYKGDLFEQMLPRFSGRAEVPIGMPTVIFRRSAAPTLRFRRDLYNGEDIIFWMEMARLTPNVAFSTRCSAICGRGVNISAAADWGTPEGLGRTSDWAKMYRLTLTMFPLNKHQQDIVNDRLARLREDFATNLWHLLRHRQRVDWQLVGSYFQSDPRLLGDIISVLGKGALRNARKTGEADP